MLSAISSQHKVFFEIRDAAIAISRQHIESNNIFRWTVVVHDRKFHITCTPHHYNHFQEPCWITIERVSDTERDRLIAISLKSELAMRHSFNVEIVSSLGQLEPLFIAGAIQSVVFIPKEYLKQIQEVVAQWGGGEFLPKYSHCSTVSEHTGYWKPLPGANPLSGGIGILAEAKELALSFISSPDKFEKIVEEVNKIHPYDVPGWNHCQLVVANPNKPYSYLNENGYSFFDAN